MTRTSHSVTLAPFRERLGLASTATEADVLVAVDARLRARRPAEQPDPLATISDDELVRQIQTAASGARVDAAEPEPTAGLSGSEAAFVESVLRQG